MTLKKQAINDFFGNFLEGFGQKLRTGPKISREAIVFGFIQFSMPNIALGWKLNLINLTFPHVRIKKEISELFSGQFLSTKAYISFKKMHV